MWRITSIVAVLAMVASTFLVVVQAIQLKNLRIELTTAWTALGESGVRFRTKQIEYNTLSDDWGDLRERLDSCKSLSVEVPDQVEYNSQYDIRQYTGFLIDMPVIHSRQIMKGVRLEWSPYGPYLAFVFEDPQGIFVRLLEGE